MSSITLKLTSLVIRTLSKPIANQIKAQAREHERFRRICVKFAQSLHRVDMRLRLGLLRDSAAIERQIQREAAEAAAKKKKAEIPTVKTEAQMKADQVKEVREAIKEKEAASEKKSAPKPKIRPLSEAKAIDSGANFISETFLFVVAGGLILFESFRSRRKETTRHEDVSDRLGDLEASEKAARRALVVLEKEILRLRAEKEGIKGKKERILPKEVWELEEEEKEEDESQQRWVERVKRWYSEAVGGGEGIAAKESKDAQDSKPSTEPPSPPSKPVSDTQTQSKTGPSTS